jgi:hypothetical protein
MTVNLSLFAGAGAQFFDNNGAILSGGLVYIYTAGTTTPQAAYTTSSGSIAHTNPIVLDSAGRVPSGGEIWLTDAVSYKFVLKTATLTTIGTYDNVTGNASGIYAAFAASSGSSLVGYTQGGTGAVTNTVQGKLREIISVKDFGAKGDGSTNDTAAFTAAAATGYPYYVPYTTNFYAVTSAPTGSPYGPGAIKVSGVDFRIPGSLPNTNAVVLINTNTSGWLLFAPNGVQISTSGTTTSGLQEAITYAVNNGFNLKVYGGGTSTVDYGLLYATTTIVFPPMRCMTVEFEGVHIQSNPTTSSAHGMTINSCMIVDFKFNGEIVYSGTGNALLFAPTVGPGVDPLVNIVDSRFYIATVVPTGSAAAAVKFDVNAGSLTNSYYQFSEINANDNGSSSATTTYGLVVQGQDTSSNQFAYNTIVCPHIHGGLVCFSLGTVATNGANLHDNTIDVDCSTTVNSATGFAMFGAANTGRISSTMTGSTSTGVNFLSSAKQNCFVLKNNATYATSSLYPTSNQLLVGAPWVASTLTPTASPYILQNTDLTNWNINVQSGTVTSIFLSVDGTTYYDTGVIAGVFPVPQGTYIKITYSSVPNVRKFSQSY